jgi:hypothetical protein
VNSSGNVHEHFHPELYVDIYNCVFFRCLATIWPWYHNGQEQERNQDVQMNGSMVQCVLENGLEFVDNDWRTHHIKEAED